MALVVRAEGPSRIVAPKDGELFTLEELQALVQGDIELVRLPEFQVNTGVLVDMLVNENGIALDLPLNPAASTLVERAIFGDVVLLRRDEWD